MPCPNCGKISLSYDTEGRPLCKQHLYTIEIRKHNFCDNCGDLTTYGLGFCVWCLSTNIRYCCDDWPCWAGCA